MLQNGSAPTNSTCQPPRRRSPAAVTDSNNNVVWSGPVRPGSGVQSYTWNGQNQSGAQQADGGTYTLKITAATDSGTAITPSFDLQGSATAVQTVNGQTMVTVGGPKCPVIHRRRFQLRRQPSTCRRIKIMSF